MAPKMTSARVASVSSVFGALLAGSGAEAACSAISSHSGKMDCGSGVSVCGVLVLETGEGSGYYQHKTPKVHGLWPQDGDYGDSKCIPPQDKTDPTQIYTCYQDPDVPESHQHEFIQHEWEKHGECAGVKNADDFFNQICGLSTEPLKIMDAARLASKSLQDTTADLQNAGHCVWTTGEDYQIELSACLDQSGKWHLADSSNFASVCGGAGPSPAPTPSPTPTPPSPSPTPTPPAPTPSPSPAPTPSPTPTPPSPSPSASCPRDEHGPKCSSNQDCIHIKDCLRCADSGYCTSQPELQWV